MRSSSPAKWAIASTVSVLISTDATAPAEEPEEIRAAMASQSGSSVASPASTAWVTIDPAMTISSVPAIVSGSSVMSLPDASMATGVVDVDHGLDEKREHRERRQREAVLLFRNQCWRREQQRRRDADEGSNSPLAPLLLGWEGTVAGMQHLAIVVHSTGPPRAITISATGSVTTVTGRRRWALHLLAWTIGIVSFRVALLPAQACRSVSVVRGVRGHRAEHELGRRQRSR